MAQKSAYFITIGILCALIQPSIAQAAEKSPPSEDLQTRNLTRNQSLILLAATLGCLATWAKKQHDYSSIAAVRFPLMQERNALKKALNETESKSEKESIIKRLDFIETKMRLLNNKKNRDSYLKAFFGILGLAGTGISIWGVNKKQS